MADTTTRPEPARPDRLPTLAGAASVDGLLGRQQERAAIDALLARLRAGDNATLVLVGPPGIGKSSLLRYAADQAGDLTVCRVVGTESEMPLDFAGLHQLLAPLLGGADALPEPQRQALAVALGQAAAEPGVDLYIVGLAALGLLARAASDRPVLVIVDDAQWLDAETARVLTFVARRLEADRVGMLVAVREPEAGPFATSGLLRLPVEPLEGEPARELLRRATEGELDDEVADQLLAAAQGNPLALVELVGALSPEQRLGTAVLPQPLPVGSGLDLVFSARANEVDDATRDLLLLAAAERVGDPTVVRRAAAALGVTDWDETVTKAEDTRLVTFAPTIEFRHPLARSAVYYSASTAQRRRAHRALAGALAAPADADRRAWHLGAAALEPDERVAHELELAAQRSRARGGASVASAFLLTAAELSPDPGRAEQRRLEAARSELTAGDLGHARSIVARVHQTSTGDRRSEIAWTDALLRIVSGQVGEAAALLAEALPLGRSDETTGVGVLAAATVVAFDAGHLIPVPERAGIAESLRRAVTGRALPEVVRALAAGAAARLGDGYEEAVPLLRQAVTAATEDRGGLVDQVGNHVHVVHFDAVLAAADLLDDRSWSQLTRSWVRLARQTGALAALPLALSLAGWLEVLQGRVRTAQSHLAEIEQIVAVTGQRGLLGAPVPAAVLLQAWQGSEREARAGARRMMQDGHERGAGRAIDQAQEALLVLEMAGGRYEAALRIARRQVDRDGVVAATLALADLVEAATRCGQRQPALEGCERLTTRAAASGSAWARGLLERSRALVAEDETADGHYRAAVEELSTCAVTTELARTHLLHGEWLRRARRRKDAREPLHAALEFFEAMGAEGFAARARQELAATGERVRRTTEPGYLLTPQEAQIARHAAAGDRNQEIAAQLFISTSTVEYHLRKIFVKLGVRSRTELAALDLPV